LILLVPRLEQEFTQPVGIRGFNYRVLRGIFFVSMASVAESFRSVCDSWRSAPEYSKQGSPAATPHVGQGTEENCFGVISFILGRTKVRQNTP
jgi:hypothetical protein